MREELYSRVKDVISKEDFEARVRQEMEAWGGLLEEEAAALLVVDELGRSEVPFGQIAGLYEGGEAFLRVKVDKIGAVREFTRREGNQGRVVNLMVSDASGRCRLVLWDDEVDMVASGQIQVGSKVKIVDGYVRSGRFGIEVSSGKWGVVLVEEP